jgi:hypothetical protein
VTKRQGRLLVPRICEHCRVNHGYTGPRPYGSQLVLVNGEILYCCSQQCYDAVDWQEKRRVKK